MALLTDTYRGRFAATTAPASSSGHALRLAYRKSAAGGDTVDLRAQLRKADDSALIKEWLLSNITDAYTVAELTLTTLEASAITSADYTGGLVYVLQREGDSTSTSSNNRSADVSWVEFGFVEEFAGQATTATLPQDSSVTATSTVPVFGAGSASETLPQGSSAVGTTSPPVFAGAATSATLAQGQSIDATAAPPVYTAVVTSETSTQASAADGAVAVPVYSAQAISETLPGTVAATGTSEAPIFVAEATSETLPQGSGAQGSVAAPGLFISVSSATLPQGSSATAETLAPVYSGTATSESLGHSTQSSASFEPLPVAGAVTSATLPQGTRITVRTVLHEGVLILKATLGRIAPSFSLEVRSAEFALERVGDVRLERTPPNHTLERQSVTLTRDTASTALARAPLVFSLTKES